jgi:hypothetical protein
MADAEETILRCRYVAGIIDMSDVLADPLVRIHNE